MKYAILSIATACVIAAAFIAGVKFGREIEHDAVMSQPTNYGAASTSSDYAPYSYDSYTPDDQGDVYTYE